MQSTVKDRIFNHIPPAMLVAVTCFWALAPEAVLESPWTLAVVSPLIIITVQLLEFVHERHQGWRLNRQEFFTDLFYVTLNATVIGWCVQVFADEPLTALKASLGLKSEWLQQTPWLFQAALVLFLIEFGQYWMHRLMHNWTPFWLTHAPHRQPDRTVPDQPECRRPV
jgi:sterol desaturase/sphingolipid hydroxylase (fatty acid hydroxylase superfamily)